MLRVTPVYGSHGHHPSSPSLSPPPSSTLIEYGGVRVLINVGWDGSSPSSSSSSSSPTTTSPLPTSTPLSISPSSLQTSSISLPSSSLPSPSILTSKSVTTSSAQVPKLPEADVLLLTDSSLQSLGGLPVYHKMRKEALAFLVLERKNLKKKRKEMLRIREMRLQQRQRQLQQRQRLHNRRGGGVSVIVPEHDDDMNQGGIGNDGNDLDRMQVEDATILGGSFDGRINNDDPIDDDDDDDDNNDENNDDYDPDDSLTNIVVPPQRPPTYATLPTVKMGQMALYDRHSSVTLDGGDPGYCLGDVDDIFASRYFAEEEDEEDNINANNADGNTNSNNNNVVDGTKSGNGKEEADGNDDNDDDDDDDDEGDGNNNNNEKENNNNNNNKNNNKKNKRKKRESEVGIKCLHHAQTLLWPPHKPTLGITPHRAGHLIGASYFVLRRLADETEVVVAPIFHHARERHLDGSTLYKYGTACDVLVCGTGGAGGALGGLYSTVVPRPGIPSHWREMGDVRSNNNNHRAIQNGHNSNIAMGAAAIDTNTNTIPSTNTTNNIPKNSKSTRGGGGGGGNGGGRSILQPPSAGRDAGQLVESVMSTLRRGGNVLLPADASGRTIEVLLLLATHWERHRLMGTYSLSWVGPVAREIGEFVRSQLEWMAAPLGARFDGGRGHPIRFSSIMDVASSVQEWDGIRKGRRGGGGEGVGGMDGHDVDDSGLGNMAAENPACVIASGAGLDEGPARDLFLRWAGDADNAIVLTDSRGCSLRGDVLDSLYMNWETSRIAKINMVKEKALIEMRNKRNKEDSKQPLVTNGDGSGMSANIGKRQEEKYAAVGDEKSYSVDCSTVPIPSATPSVVEEEDILDMNDHTHGYYNQHHEHLHNENITNGIAEDNVDDDENPHSSLPIATSPSPHATSGQLLLEWCKARLAGEEMADSVEVDVPVPRRAPLGGKELDFFLAGEEKARRRERIEEERRAMLREVELAKGRLRLDDAVVDRGMVGNGVGGNNGGLGSTSTVGDEMGTGVDDEKTKGKRPEISSLTKGGNSASVNGARSKKRGRFDANLFLRYSKPSYMTFEVVEEAVGLGQPDSVAKHGIGESVGRVAGEVPEDDYGIAVRPERFADVISGVDPSIRGGSGNAGIEGGRIGSDIRRRGLGFGSDRNTLLTPGSVKDENGVDIQDDIKNKVPEKVREALDLADGRGIIRGRNGKTPVKVTTVRRRIEVFAEVSFVPLEGRADAAATRQSVRALQPRRAVILGGGTPPMRVIVASHFTKVNSLFSSMSKKDGIKGEAGLLAEAVRSLHLGDRGSGKGRGSSTAFIPTEGNTVELSVGHAAYPVRLVDAVGVNTTKEEPFEAVMGECRVSLIDYVATGQRVAADGSIVLAPRTSLETEKDKDLVISGDTNKANVDMKKKVEDTVMISDGDVLLTDLRSEVIALGMKAEYSAHSGYYQLLLNGKILVRKDQATGKISIEGPLCEDFFAVRSVVCSQYVTL